LNAFASDPIAEAILGAREWHPDDDPGPAARRAQVEVGSDVEIAGRVSQDLHESFGRIIHADGDFWRYEGTCWRPIPEAELRRAVHIYDGAEYMTPAHTRAAVKLGKSRVTSALHEMSAMLAMPTFFVDAPTGINCASGFIEFSGDGAPTLKPHSPEHRARHTLPGRYGVKITPEQAASSLLKKLLQGCFMGDTDADAKISFLGEIAGAVAIGWSTRLKKPKAIILKGETAENGKSQILDLLRGLLPETAICSIPPQKLADERFVVALAGKLLNASDELTSASAIGSDSFKSAITGDPMTGRAVYQQPIEFRPMALHVYATNDLPTFRGGMDRGVLRRLGMLTFHRTIPPAERIEHIGQRIGRDEADLLLDFAVEGAKRLIARGYYAEPPSSDRAIREWALGADPIQAWLAIVNVTGNVLDRVKTSDAYRHFKEWALEQGYRLEALPAVNQFTQRVKAHRPQITSVHPQRVSHLCGLLLDPAPFDGGGEG
jgi:P4 family phage/plasmid primase-like protien